MALERFFRSLDHFSKFRYKLWYYPTKICIKNIKNEILLAAIFESQALGQGYTYRVLQTIEMKFILLSVWAEWAVLDRAKKSVKYKYEI